MSAVGQRFQLHCRRTGLSVVSDVLHSAPGVVTAANEFFIRTKADIDNLGLSEYVKPILKKGSFASPYPVFTTADFEALSQREPCFLLHLDQDRTALSLAVQA